MLDLNISKQSLRFLSSLDNKQHTQIIKKIFLLMKDPYSQDSIKLTGFDINIYRADCGEYRLIYYPTENMLYVRYIGKRNDGEVYKKFLRKVN